LVLNNYMYIPFIRKRKYWYIFSGLLVTLSVASLSIWGLKPGIDFTGGSLLEVQFTGSTPSTNQLEESIKDLNLGVVSVQPSDGQVFIFRLRDINEDEYQSLLISLSDYYSNNFGGQVTPLRFESIGPSVGADLKNRALIATVLTLMMIILFIAYAFRKISRPVASWKYGLATLAALFHDIIILLGVFSVLGKFFGYEANILFLTAILTTLGYSINDNIVIFDRIRENIFTRREDFFRVVEDAMNQTLSRSINTGFSSLLVLFAVYFFGGETLKQFVLALIIGISVGTYSSILISSPLLVDWFLFTQNRKNKIN